MTSVSKGGPAGFRVRWATRDLQRAGVAVERVEVVDPTGDALLSLTLGQVYSLAGRLVEVGGQIAEAYPESVEGLICEPAATAADLATVFEMGRRSGLGSGPGRVAALRAI